MFTATPVCSVARCLRNLGSMKGAACLGQHHSADTLRNDHGFPGSPGLPNRGGQGGTSKVWPRAKCAPRSTGLGSSRANGPDHFANGSPCNVSAAHVLPSKRFMRNLLCVVGRHEWRTKYDTEGRPYEMCGRPQCYHRRNHDSPPDGPGTGTDRGSPPPPFQPPTYGGGVDMGGGGGGGG